MHTISSNPSKLFWMMALMFTLTGNATAMEPLNDGALSAVTGQEGIALDLDLGINMEPDSNGDFNVSQGLGGCTGTNTDCRLALEFAGRPDKWLVLKNFFGYLDFNNIFMDASTLPNSDSIHDDPTRFEDEGGACLLSGCDPNGLAALQLSFGSQPAGQYDIEGRMNIGRLAAEFGATGYDEDQASGSVLGFRMLRADGNTAPAPARATVDGQMFVYGF